MDLVYLQGTRMWGLRLMRNPPLPHLHWPCLGTGVQSLIRGDVLSMYNTSQYFV
jgi:hypothetical protein